MRKPRERELQADCKQKHHDSDLGQDMNLRNVVNQVETVGPYYCAGDQKSDNGRKVNSLENQDDDDRESENDHQVLEKLEMRHYI
jgi:hypothetical protein